MLQLQQSRLNLDPRLFEENFDREPFGFTHNLNVSSLFQLDSLHSLARLYENGRDCFVAAGARAAGTRFYSVPSVKSSPADALDKIDQGSFRILLKRPEQRHDGF